MKHIATIILAVSALIHSYAAEYRWEADVDGIISTETGGAPRAYLWIEPGCDSIRALIFAFQNMNEETLFSSPRFRAQMAADSVGILWIAPGFGQEWDIMQGVQDAFDGVLAKLAARSGHGELTSVPLIPFGHSAQATMPWNFAAWNPSRTLCIISYHGDAPRTNLCGYGRSNVEWGRNRNIDGIPGLMVMGEYEWWDARLRPALAFRMMYPASCISFLGDAGRGHFDLADITADYIVLFIHKSLKQRLNGKDLVRISPENGWLAESWHPGQTTRTAAAPFADYKGCRHEAFWYFDREMAQLAEARYAATRGKKPRWLGFMQKGRLLAYNPKAHCKMSADVVPDADDCFTMEAAATDSTRTMTVPTQRQVEVRYVSGPAIPLGDNRFRIDRSHPSWHNPRRAGKITLCAELPGDAEYKEAVQEIEVTVK